MAKPAFHGQLKERPFPEVLLEIYRWRLTGTLAVWPEQPKPGFLSQDRIRVEEGVPVSALFIDGARGLRDGVLSVMSRTRAVFAFYDANLVGTGPAVVTGVVSVYDLLAESLRRHPRKDSINKMLQLLHRGKIRVRPDADLDAFMLQPEEQDFIKLLRAAPGELGSVMRFASQHHVAERVLLLLSLVNAIEIEHNHPVQSLRPPKLQTGILTEEMFGPGVYLSSKTREGPQNTQMRARRTSSVQMRKSNSVPPNPGDLSDDMRVRWDGLVDMALAMDDQTHFEVLGVKQEATDEEITEAYLHKVAAFSPEALPQDLRGLKPMAHRLIERLVSAKAVLSDPMLRTEYLADVRMGIGTPNARKLESAKLRSNELFMAAKANMRQSNWEEALMRIREARSFDHRDGRLLATEAWCRFNVNPTMDDFQELVSLLKQALALDPSLEDVYFYLGSMNERLGRGREAREAFRVLLRINPEHKEARDKLERLQDAKIQASAKGIIAPFRRRPGR